MRIIIEILLAFIVGMLAWKMFNLIFNSKNICSRTKTENKTHRKL